MALSFSLPSLTLALSAPDTCSAPFYFPLLLLLHLPLLLSSTRLIAQPFVSMKFHFSLLELHLHRSLLHPSRWERLLCPPQEAPSSLLPPPCLPASSLFANTLHEEAASIKINRAEIWETETTPTSHFIIGNGNLFDFHLQTVACICSSPWSPSPCAVFCANSGSPMPGA